MKNIKIKKNQNLKVINDAEKGKQLSDFWKMYCDIYDEFHSPDNLDKNIHDKYID